jgi:hypothetical protein
MAAYVDLEELIFNSLTQQARNIIEQGEISIRQLQSLPILNLRLLRAKKPEIVDGVYLRIDLNERGGYELYVGSSGNLLERIRQHEVNFKFNKEGIGLQSRTYHLLARFYNDQGTIRNIVEAMILAFLGNKSGPLSIPPQFQIYTLPSRNAYLCRNKGWPLLERIFKSNITEPESVQPLILPYLDCFHDPNYNPTSEIASITENEVVYISSDDAIGGLTRSPRPSGPTYEQLRSFFGDITTPEPKSPPD